MRYLFVIERTAPPGVSGYFPDVPGCTCGADNLEDLLEVAPGVLESHLEDQAIPEAHSLKWHWEQGLELDPTDLLACIEYRASALAV